MQVELRADREQRDWRQCRADPREDRVQLRRKAAERPDDEAEDHRVESGKIEDALCDHAGFGLAAGIDRRDRNGPDRQRDEAAELIGDDGERHAFLAAQLFDQREAHERGVSEPRRQDHRADPRARPAQQPAERGKQGPRAEEHQPHGDRQEPELRFEMNAGISSSTSAGSATFSTHQLSEPVNPGGSRTSRATNQPSARQTKSSRSAAALRRSATRRASPCAREKRGAAASAAPSTGSARSRNRSGA